MKKYNRIYAMILVILMLASLTACSSHGTVAGDNQSWKNVWDFRTESAISDAGYYYFVNSSIWFADLQSGTAVPLCTKAGCAHNSSSCDVYIKTMDRVFFYGDSLYSIEKGNYGTTLYRRDATGMARMKVADLGTKYTKEEKVLSVKYFGCAGDYLYYSAEVSAMVYDEEIGGMTNANEVQYISRVDLRTGKETYIFEDPVEAFYDVVDLLAVREDGFLFYHLNATDVRKDDAGFLDILNADPVAVKYWNSSTGEITTLLKTTRGDFTQGICVTGGKICYTSMIKKDSGNWTYGASAYDLDTGKKELLFQGSGAFLGNGYLLRSVSGTTQRFVYDLAAGKEYPCDMFEGIATLRLSSDKGAVLSINVLETGGRVTESRYYFVPREAMADGIQEADLLYLYAQKYSN